MKTTAIGAKTSELITKAQQISKLVPQKIHEFESVLQSLQEHNQDARQFIHQPTAQPAPGSNVSAADRRYQQKLQEARDPGGIQRLMGEMEQAHRRLNVILREVQGGKTFTPQELLGLQAEMHQITLQLEATTKVISQVVSGVKQLMQQQI